MRCYFIVDTTGALCIMKVYSNIIYRFCLVYHQTIPGEDNLILTELTLKFIFRRIYDDKRYFRGAY